MFHSRLTNFLVALTAFAALSCSEPAPAPEETPPAAAEAEAEEATVLVVFETALGDVEVELYPDRAPISVEQFLRYVDGSHYDGGSFYRATRTEDGAAFDIVQGGIRPMVPNSADEPEVELPFPPIAHETTDITGMLNERGVLAYGRLAPGTANSEFFFNLGDSRVLNSGVETPGRDGYGYATFGRVVSGIEVLDEIRQLPTDGPTDREVVRGQILTEPIGITTIRRATPPG